MRVIVTRPEREARRWSEQLSARGFDAVSLPLIAIAPMTGQPARQALESAWQGLQAYFAVMFVSASAVTYFFSSKPTFSLTPWSLSVTNSGATSRPLPRCWAPGPGTAQALQQAGVPAHAIDAPPAESGQFDSEALWQRVRAGLPAGARVLIVRGSDGGPGGAGRDWLAQQLAGAGVQVQT
ncbi:MAG: uroporphyrinogen-III synthase, partial [Rhodoferax sp.]